MCFLLSICCQYTGSCGPQIGPFGIHLKRKCYWLRPEGACRSFVHYVLCKNSCQSVEHSSEQADENTFHFINMHGCYNEIIFRNFPVAIFHEIYAHAQPRATLSAACMHNIASAVSCLAFITKKRINMELNHTKPRHN